MSIVIPKELYDEIVSYLKHIDNGFYTILSDYSADDLLDKLKKIEPPQSD